MDATQTVSMSPEPGALWRPVFLGREEAIADLNAAIVDEACRMVILRGPAGSGKTTLVEVALRSLPMSPVFSGEAKFAEGAVESPYAPILRALSLAVSAALDRMHDPEPVMSAMAEALGPALAVLSAAGFRPGGAFSAESAQGLIGRRQGAARIVDATLRLVRWLGGFEIPILLFIDDWRRGGDEARAMLETIADEGEANLTLVLAERDDLPPMALSDEGKVRRVEVGALGAAERRQLLRAALGEAGDALHLWFGDAGPNLPFDLLAAARALADVGAFERIDGDWRIDAARAAAIGRDDLARTLVKGLASASADAQSLALAAALFGDSAPVSGLAAALDYSGQRLEAAIATVASLGIVEQHELIVRFRHDRLRAAVQGLGLQDVRSLAAEMADRLAAVRDPEEHDWRLPLRLRHYAGVDRTIPAIWRDRFASGANAARAAMDIDAASRFADSGWLLRAEYGPGDAISDRLLVREAILAAADRNDATSVIERIGCLLDRPVTWAEMGDDYELAIAALRLVGEKERAWELSRSGLARFGMKLPEVATPLRLLAPLARWKFRHTFMRRPVMAATSPVAVDPLTKIGNAAGALAFERSPLMAALLALNGVERASPTTRQSPLLLANDVFLCAMRGEFEEAARLGEIAFDVARAPGYRGYAHASTLYRALYWGVIWRRPQGSLRQYCRTIRELALAEGDLIQAAVAIRNWVMVGWRTAPSLSELRQEIVQARVELARLGDADVQQFVAATAGAVDHLLGLEVATPVVEAFRAPADAPAWALNVHHGNPLLTIELASLHGDWDYIRRLVDRTPQFRRNLDSHPRGADWRFHDGLARLRRGERVIRRDMAYLRRAARLNPADNHAKLLILRAEALRSRGRQADCLAAFAEAVEAANSGWSRLEAGVACECAAHAARSFGNGALAEHYDRRARDVWVAWGARIKVGRAAPHIDPGAAEGQPLVDRVAEAESQALVAERNARARSRFLADVAHELRTPLQGMQGLLDLAAAEPDQLDLTSIRDVFSSLKTVVNDLTDFGALSSGDAPLEKRPTPIIDLVRSECDVAASFAREHGATVELTIAPDVPPVVDTDGPRVRQVLRNLLSNAAKYGRGGSISVSLAVADEQLIMTVEDRGPGFTAADLLHLFEPFERGARAGDGQGLGLGLALSRRIALRLEGALAAENRPDGGARFSFVFPLESVEAKAPDEALSARTGLRILLAEDVPLVRRVLSAILESQGHEVTEAEDGLEASALISALDLDLAILDLGMPGLNGLEVLQCIGARAGGWEAAPPVILLTASGEADIREQAVRAGAAGVLRKPVSAEELARAVARFCPSGSADPGAPSLGDMLGKLRDEARADLSARIDTLALSGGASLASDAHRIAGLAAQFGWPDIAATADAVERAALDDDPALPRAIEALRLAAGSLRNPAQDSRDIALS
jgi:signal transduction histidine kinase/ActR/RegA family two-component response regulator